jgi:hypothetical protein
MDDFRPIRLNGPSGAQRKTPGYCQSCGARAPTKRVEFYRLIGAVILLHFKSAGGQMCKSCVHQHFWEYTALTLCLGWWSVISFFLTPFIVLHNVIRYACCLGMLPAPRIQPRDGAPARAAELPPAGRPAAKRIEIIWDLPEGPVKKTGDSKPKADSQAEPGPQPTPASFLR